MNDTIHRGLLPAGLADILPPEAELEAHVTENIVASFAKYGYQRVKPPLIEFEEVLLSGSGSATANQTFRMMDPISQRMLGVRTDMTIQIARIASTRLGDVPRPIRLSYAGQVLRVKGSNLRPKRQFGQIGAELIGSPSPQADAEVVLMAANALTEVGVANLSVDLGLPTLVQKICDALKITSPNQRKTLDTALSQKDAPAIEALRNDLGDQAVDLFSTLLQAVGTAESAIKTLSTIEFPAEAKSELDTLIAVFECLKKRAPGIAVTIDPVESRGYEYHTGVSFTFFAHGIRGEIGRGGRYLAENTNDEDLSETATGVSLFVDSILRALPEPLAQERVFISASLNETADTLRNDGWAVVEHFLQDEIPNNQIDHLAKQAGCSHYWDGSKVSPVSNS